MRRIVGSASLVVVAVAGLLVAPGVAAGQSLNGLYLQNQSIGRGSTVWHYYYFWPDGHMCNVIPKGGMNPAPSYATVAAANPGECGTFALRGNQLQLQTSGNGRPAVALKIDHFDNSGFALSDFPTIRVPAFPAGATLNGRWKTLIIKGSDYRDEAFTFRPDGSFSFDDVPVRTVGAPARHIQGTYRISGNTLQLSAGGAGQLSTIHAFPGTGDTRISIDGNVFDTK